MVLIALSFQDQVEKYGAYVGIAAFFGLAVLSLLYFSQARELKRLREWAGRAPERARELEQRVVAQASATVARRGPAMPAAPAKGGIAPPRRLAEMPVPPAATQAAAGAQATELAEAVDGEPATNGSVPVPPVGPGGSVPAGRIPANGVPPAAQEQAPGADDEPARADAEAPAAAAANGASAEPAAPADETASPQTPAPTAGAAPPAAAPPAAPQPAAPAASAPDDAPPAAGVPRATPAQRVGVTPRPAPMPLRQSKPTATPRGGGAGRRPATPAGRRPGAKPPREGRSAGTVALLVGLAVLILGGGVFLGSRLLGGDDEPTPPNRAAPPPTQTADSSGGGGGGGGGGASPKPKAETNVAVLNGTTQNGLAGSIADRISQEGGYERGITENNRRDQSIEQSVVYYADGFRSSARAVGQFLSVERFEPLDSETASLAPGADVVVLAGADQAP